MCIRDSYKTVRMRSGRKDWILKSGSSHKPWQTSVPVQGLPEARLRRSLLCFLLFSHKKTSSKTGFTQFCYSFVSYYISDFWKTAHRILVTLDKINPFLGAITAGWTIKISICIWVCLVNELSLIHICPLALNYLCVQSQELIYLCCNFLLLFLKAVSVDIHCGWTSWMRDNCLKILYLQYFVDLFYLAKSKT